MDLEKLQTRLRKMNDEKLLRFEKAARFMCSDKTPRQGFVVRLEEAIIDSHGGVIRELECLAGGFRDLQPSCVFRTQNGRVFLQFPQQRL
jgi:hypothetical protein